MPVKFSICSTFYHKFIILKNSIPLGDFFLPEIPSVINLITTGAITKWSDYDAHHPTRV